MSIDPRYMIAPSLQEIFLDKDTGLPLVGGKVTYYSDNNRLLLKPIYTISGNAPDYQYVPIPNPNTLSSIGTTTDANGNDVLPYYFPYDSNGNLELYFIKVESALSVLQFDRSAYPNVTSGGAVPVGTIDITNYIPNGQFLAHTNIPATTDTVAGQITQAETPIAYGGWYFERSSGSTATDIVTFLQNTNFQANPPFSPRYSCNIACTSPDTGDVFKYLSIRFNDVNKFASANEPYTFCFNAFATNQIQNVSFSIYKFYGTGGSTPTTTSFGTETITTTATSFSLPLVFGDNSGQTVGSVGDDYLELVVQLPVGFTFNATFTDFMLLQGSVSTTNFVPQTNADMLTRSITGGMPVPDPAGFDLYLPLTLTPSGMIFDDSQIGKIESSSTGNVSVGELFCDGSIYQSTQYSPDGIPYARLQRKYIFNANGSYKNASGIPIYGTGLTYFTAALTDYVPTYQFILHNNSQGVVTATADGSNPTNFTFSTIASGVGTFYGVTTAWTTANGATDANFIVLRNVDQGSATLSTAGNSGFTVENYIIGNAFVKQETNISTIVATSLAGKYWTFNNTLGDIYVWYKVNGSGSDPAPGGTGILVNLSSTDSATTVAQKTANTLNGWQVTNIIAGAASTFLAGAYFTAMSTSAGYYIWYTINGVGTDPSVVSRTGIKVAVLSTDTSQQVTLKTCIAINSVSYAVPDLRGYFLRGIDPDAQVDDTFRSSLVDYANSNYGQLATIQFDTNQSHLHPTSAVVVQVDINNPDKLIKSAGIVGGGLIAARVTGDGYDFSTTTDLIGSTASGATGNNGYSQSQPINANVMYLVKY